MKLVKSEDIKSAIPFVRLAFTDNSKANSIDKLIAGRNIYPELFTVIVTFLAFKYFPYQLNTTRNISAFITIIIILILLFTTALINVRTMLIPNLMLKPLFGVIVLYLILISNHFSNGNIIVTSLLGALVLGGIPYIIFQVTSGKWIGGGDVKLGFVTGVLLGFRFSLVCFWIMLVLTGLSLAFEYRSIKSTRIPTGVLWSCAVVTSLLLSWVY